MDASVDVVVLLLCFEKHTNNICTGRYCTVLSVRLCNDTKTDKVANKQRNAPLSVNDDNWDNHIEC